MELIGIALFLFGIFGLVIKKLSVKNISKNVSASNGSVAAGGKIKGDINIVNISTKETASDTSVSWAIWNILCGLATLVGLVLTAIPLLK